MNQDQFPRLWPPITEDAEKPKVSAVVGNLPKWEDQKKARKYIKYAGTIYKLVK